MSVLIRKLLTAALLLVAIPAASYAQASIAGAVKDTSGAVLPGVTVEAASPNLTEKTRSVVSDGSGQYKIINLPPGTYSVTFTLPGFNVVKREGIELTGSFTASINVDMKVGGLQETILVTGGTPIVDVQSSVKERVLTKEIIDAIPTGKYYSNLAALIPGVTVASAPSSASGSTQDVGGTGGDSQALLSVHGSRGGDQRMTINGIPFGEGNGSTHGMGPNTLAMQEVSVGTGSVDASMGQGGVRINFVPKEGGNRFSGGIAYSGANANWQSDNLTPDLLARGANSVPKVETLYDVAPTFGGPIVKDKLWFFGAWRRNVVNDYVTNGFQNLNANPALGNANPYTFAKDLNNPIVSRNLFRYASARVTWQATPRNKFSGAYDLRDRCGCPQSTTALESGMNNSFKPMNITSVTWTSPVTSRLLLEAGANYLDGSYYYRPTDGFVPGAIQVTEVNPLPGNPATYRGRPNDQTTLFPTLNTKFIASYVTGSHAATVGFQFGNGKNAQTTFSETPDTPYTYQLTNGIPSGITVQAYPQISDSRTRADIGLYAQDKWTVKRMTLSYGLRFDYLNTYAAPVTLPAAPLAPNRVFSFPETPQLAWKDITPKLSFVYDLFGNGQTAIKTSLNRYLGQQAAGGVGSVNLNPAALVVNSTGNRVWNDANGNFFPDCDLANGAAQDLRASGGDQCGAWTGSGVNFGKAVPATTVDPDTQFGWGKRQYNWEFSAGVQQGLTPRISMDISYFRRWYGNFLVVDNRAVSASDYQSFSVTAPVDSRLPGGGNNTVSGFVNVNPNVASKATDNFQTFSDNYGKQYEHWNGVDFAINVRLGGGVIVQGGTSTGRTVTDNCEVLAIVPEATIVTTGNAATPGGTIPYCHNDSGWTTQLKALASYRIPKVDVQVSGTYQSVPGPILAANVTYTAAQTTLGRAISGGQTLALNVITPGSLYGERLNQLDLRFGKIVKYRQTRSTISLDLFNLTNANAVTAESSTYSQWRTPTAILAPRILKISANFDF